MAPNMKFLRAHSGDPRVHFARYGASHSSFTAVPATRNSCLLIGNKDDVRVGRHAMDVYMMRCQRRVGQPVSDYCSPRVARG